MNPHGGAAGENSSQEDNYHHCSQKHFLGAGGGGSFSSQDLLGGSQDPGFDSDEFNNMFPGIQDSSLLAGEPANSRYSNPILGADAMFQPIGLSEGAFSQNSFGMPLTGSRDDSFGQFANSSFDLAALGDEMSQLSQPNGNDGFGLLNNETPPPSSGSENGAEQYENLGGNNGIQLPGVKSEVGRELELFQGSQQVRYLDNDDAVADSSQDESQGGRLPVLERYGGKYAFRVTPAVLAGPRKCIFNSESNTVFCVDDNSILFHITLDFSAAPLKKLYVQAVIYYSACQLVSKNVERCGNCREHVAKSTQSQEDTDMNGGSLEGYIVRCDNPRAEYYKKRGSHNCVAVPLEKLQPGADRILRNYIFKCKNSCHTKKGKEARSWTLVFYLMEGDREVGRDVYKIKVCKCPYRDYLNETTRRPSSTGLVGVAISPKREPGVKLEAEVNRPPPKQARMSKELDVAAARQGAASSSPRPGPSRLARGSSSTVLPEANGKDCQDTDSESFSQEDSQNTSGTSIILKMTESMKLALAHRRHTNDIYREYSTNWIKQLKDLEGSMKFYRTHIVKGSDLSAILEDGQNGDEGERSSQD